MTPKIKTILYSILMIAALATIIGSLIHYKTSAHDYEECASTANIAALNDLEFNTAIDPEYKPKKSEQNQKNISNQISCSDLSAQWAMSDIAMMGYIAGLFGLVFLGVTVFETKSAATSAAAALEEAQEATGIARQGAFAAMQSVEVAKSQVRPFLSINKACVQSFEVGLPVEVEFEIKNFGVTPATLLGINKYVIAVPKGKQHTPPRAKHNFSDIIPPTGERHFSGLSKTPLTQGQVDSFTRLETEFMAILTIVFSDQYGVWRNYFFVGKINTDGINRSDSVIYTLAEESERPAIDDYFPYDLTEDHLTDLPDTTD